MQSLTCAFLAASLGGLGPFFAMDTGTKDASHQTAEEQVALVKELGFEGIAPIFTSVPELRAMLAAADAQSIPVNALYVGMLIDNREAAVTPDLREAVAALKGRQTFLWLYLRSEKYGVSSTQGDADADAAVRALADVAAHSGLRVALYPHTAFWMERIEDAVRVAQACGAPNVGVTFNLCHWLKVDGSELESRLRLAMPCLELVTINGADVGGEDWTTLIQPLDSGSYDVAHFLSVLTEVGYSGPIGLQHYGITGDVRENLSRSMAAWRKMQPIPPITRE